MHIIIGLGNPTSKYDGTRHNIGFDSITRLCDDYHVKLDTKKHKAIYGAGVIAGEKVILVQPQTYMNLSGESVRELMDYYKVTNEQILVIYDDISLDIGQLRLRKKGSAGGHNGIKNIISQIGTDEFCRIKVGVGEKPANWDLADYVLSRFDREDESIIRDSLKRVSDACYDILANGFDFAMNRYNQREAK